MSPGKSEAPNSSNDLPPELDVPVFDQPEPGPGDPVGEGGGSAPEFIGPDVFYEMHFKGGFAVSNMGYAMATKSEPLQSLAAAPDIEGARECSDAIYEIVRETASLHFLIKPQSVWFQRITVIGGFGYVVAMSVNAEIQFRREDELTRPEPQPEPETAPEPEPEPDSSQDGTIDLREPVEVPDELKGAA